MTVTNDRILTTHVGSLPRPESLLEFFEQRQAGESIDSDAFDQAVREATESVVRRQDEIGIDIASSGEQNRLSFVTYVVDRLSGFDGESPAIQWADLEEFPEYAREVPTFSEWSEPGATIPAVTGPIEYDGEAETRSEYEHFEQAIEAGEADFEDTFVTAASPGAVASYLGNEYYESHEAFTEAIADAIRQEYELIAETGATLQIDAPDLLGGRHLKFKDRSDAAFVDVAKTHIDALNDALEEIPREQVRIHTCWGNYEGPHHHDIPLAEVLPHLTDADVGGLLLEQANPCHQHDYHLLAEHSLPDDWTLVPGVIDVTVNYVEPPAVIADRIERFVDAIGDPTRIVAGADCGLGTFAGFGAVHPEIAWKKLESLVEGAELASERVF
ncbi:cobalamin-independent methionine synthase II family protein [Halobellus clavatus]|jgi:5-methyltetrahydropteroyltriglutamate--homocysteine methyltransferase|uniref:5-methyltetrahydropteroyltriglutamate--homocysteine methyltransferase n=1 Tax=Halobellus clavatus TaxID=660517 RepID=A0A1H3EFU0_9EURY|nr:cobalamin-independent methionine synthase II family protein [Halobellus clavatus]SDX77490.1 5-methyltetrahydropteroyltriglutamate--homocysteine methyltransferase [Halobellus clavatus]